MTNRFELHTTPYKLLLSGYDKMIKAIGYKQKGNGYQDAVREFLSHLETSGMLSIKKLKPMEMIEYFEYLTTRPNITKGGILSSSTISNHMSSINLFFDYLLKENIITKSVIMPKISRGDAKQRNILTIDEINELYSVCENKRDKAILTIAYGCGLRRAEIEQLNVADVQLGFGVLIVRNGKGEKRREIPLSDVVINDLKDYLINERHKYFKDKTSTTIESFLINNRSKRMKGDNINTRLKELIQKTNNPDIIKKEITLHCLRHSISVHLLDNNADIEFVKDFLGHKDIDIVHVYARRRKAKLKLQQQLMQ